MRKILDRKKVNFMIGRETLMQFYQLIPSGERSNFLNTTLKEALINYGRQKASEQIDKFRKEWKLKLSTEELIQLKNYGRE